MKIACVLLLSAAALQGSLAGSWITRAGKFQGDIALTLEQERQLNASRFGENERQAIIFDTSLWPGNKIPYVINSVFSSSEISTINEAIADYTANTCIEWVERTNEADYIEIIKDGGCWSYVGRWSRRGRQELSLANGCVWKYIIIHEMMHAAGFYHEQSRYDRDDYVDIFLENVCCNAEGNFDKLTTSNSKNLDEPYDLKSVMHYGERDFSSNGQKTIQAKDGTTPLGNSNGFTQTDINKLNKLYQCSATTSTTEASTTATGEPSTTTEEVTTTEEPCQDLFSTRRCGRLVSRLGCNNRRVLRNCALTCGACTAGSTTTSETTTQGDCVDTDSRCARRARRGHCTSGRRQRWMAENCPESCDLC